MTRTPELEAAIRASLARVSARAAEFMVAHDDWSVDVCLATAMAEEVLVYGLPGGPEPVGLMWESPIQSLREKYHL